MQYSEAKQGRVFVIRLEDGDLIREEIERFAQEQSISCASLIIHGGVDGDNAIIVGPEEGRAKVIQPMEYVLNNPHEITGTETLFPDEIGKPVLHLHISCGRGDSAVVGCVRAGVRTWHVMEVILVELLECTASRKFDHQIGLGLLNP